MFRRKHRDSSDAGRLSLSHQSSPSRGANGVTFAPTLNKSTPIKPHISTRRSHVQVQSLDTIGSRDLSQDRSHSPRGRRRSRTTSAPPPINDSLLREADHVSPRVEPIRPKAKPTAIDSSDSHEDNRRGWLAGWGIRRSSSPNPFAKRARKQPLRQRKSKNLKPVVYDEKTIPFSNKRASRRSLTNLHADPVIKGVGLQTLDITHYVVLLARSTAELLLATMVLAFLFAVLLLIVDADQVSTGKDATFFQCFSALVSLQLTGTDDWAPIKLKLEAGTYLVITSCYVIGSIFRLGFLGLLMVRISVRPKHIKFSTWMTVHAGNNNADKTTAAPTLELRIGHIKAFSDPILQGEVHITAAYNKHGPEGGVKRVFKKLPLVTSNMAKVPPVWNVQHIITQKSPFFNASWSELEQSDLEVTVLFSGIDSTTMHPIYHVHTYHADRLVFQAQFVPVIESYRGSKRTAINFQKFNKVEVEYPVNGI